MPQMAPLMWITLFWFFIMLFILFMTTNFFFKNYLPKKIEIELNKVQKNWKW